MITIITNGFQFYYNDVNWLEQMAQATNRRHGGHVPVYDVTILTTDQDQDPVELTSVLAMIFRELIAAAAAAGKTTLATIDTSIIRQTWP